MLEPGERNGGGSFGGAALVGSLDFLKKVKVKASFDFIPKKWNTSSEITFCWYCRDESASATYYCKKKSVSETEEESTPNMEKEWIYYRKLKSGEEERCLRHKQVPPGAAIKELRQDQCVFRTDTHRFLHFGHACSLLPWLGGYPK